MRQITERVAAPIALIGIGLGLMAAPGVASGDTTFRVEAAHSGLCIGLPIEATRRGAPLRQMVCDEGDGQRFTAEPVGDGSGAVRVRVMHTGLCLDVEDASGRRGARVVQWSCNDGENQHFIAAKQGEGYVVEARHSGLCLDVQYAAEEPGARVIQYPCHGEPNQNFRPLGLADPEDPGDPTDPTEPGQWWRPAPGTTWQWQLSGTIDTSIDVEMYDIDLFETPQATIDGLKADGRVVICYFSAGSQEEWRPDADDFPEVVLGGPVDGWPGERWLDIRRLDILGPIMAARFDLAAAKRCDGVETDLMDGYQNDSGLPLTAADQLTYNRWLAEQAHARGLSIGLKNDLDQVAQLVDDFDWAINEQCFEYNECAMLLPFINAGKAVFGVEYSGSVGSFCPTANGYGFSWLKKRLALDAWRRDCQAL